MSNEVLVERRGAVQVIVINRPEARNALNRAVAVGIRDAVDELDGLDELRAGVLAGAGGTFSSGMDLKAFLGGGFELLLACDLVVAGASARFGVPEVKRSLVAGAGGALLLAQRVPRALALELLLTGDPIDAARAAEIGLVNRVVPEGGALEAAIELAERIAANGPLAVLATKQIALQGGDWAPDQ